jgi:flagellar hook assembly protein FlgD
MASGIPAHFGVSHAPNPVVTTVRMQFELPLEGHVSIQVYDALGREVVTLVNASRTAGVHYTDFDASRLQKGLYYYRITVTAGQKAWVQTRKMIVAR